MEPFSRFLRSPLVTAAKYAVSIGLLALLASQVNGPDLRHAAKEAGFIPFAAAIVLAGAAYPLCAVRWWLLLRTTNCPLPFRRAHAVVWIGQFYNAFLPGGIGGDATRLAYAFRDYPDQRAAVATATAADRLIGFAVLLLMATGGLVAHGLSGRLPSDGPAVVIALVLCVIFVSAGFVALPWMASKAPEIWARPLLKLRGDIPATLWATSLSAGVWILDFVSGWILARALGLPLGPVEVGSALAVAYTSTLLPISLGGHGVREGALVLTLQWLSPEPGLPPQLLGAFALLFLGTNLACSSLGGLVLLAGRRLTSPPAR